MTICVCEANGGVLPRQVLIDPDGRPVLIRTIFAAKKGTSLSRCLLLAEMVGILPRAKQQQRVAFADFSAAPWQGFEKSERCPNNSSLFLPQAAVVVVALG